MKNLIAKYWKKIVIFIGLIFIVLNTFYKIIAKKTMLGDYIKYGITFNGPKIKHGFFSTLDMPNSIISPEMVKYCIIFMVAILFVVFITSLANRGSDKAKKK